MAPPPKMTLKDKIVIGVIFIFIILLFVAGIVLDILGAQELDPNKPSITCNSSYDCDRKTNGGIMVGVGTLLLFIFLVIIGVATWKNKHRR